MSEPICSFQVEHIETLSILKTEVFFLKSVIPVVKELSETLLIMAGDNKSILLTLQTQGKALERQGQLQDKMFTEMEAIKDIMGTKDNIAKIYARIKETDKKIEDTETRTDSKIEILDDKVERIQLTPAEEALKEKKQIRWMLIVFVILSVANIFWDKIKIYI